jgi:hypothetical protein
VRISINLLPKQSYEDLNFKKKALIWLTTSGKAMFIFVEALVLGVFLYRFYLDKRIADLAFDIENKKIILMENQRFEADFNTLQAKIQYSESLKKITFRPYDITSQLLSYRKNGVVFENIEIQKGIVFVRVKTNGIEPFATLLDSLDMQKEIASIVLKEVEFDPKKSEYRIILNLVFVER